MVDLKNGINSTLDGEGEFASYLISQILIVTLNIYTRRTCPGSYLAEAEMFSAFVHILAQCTIEPPVDGMPDIDGAVNSGLHFLPLPCKLRFIKRSDSYVVQNYI